nr:hypothetical protein [Bacillus pumilus]
MGVLSHEMNPDTLREIVHRKLEEIEEKIKSFRFMQDLLANLLKTSDQEIHEYIKAFRVTTKDEQSKGLKEREENECTHLSRKTF